MKPIHRVRALLLALASLTLPPALLAHTLEVSNVEQLYAAVNNGGNAGATVRLAAGTYRLSVADPQGVARPKGGRIELQFDMSLQGVKGNREAVVIDAFDLPAASFPQAGAVAGPNAAVRTGLGRNALEWLTVRGARFAQANIDTGLQPLDPGTTWIRIAHVASTGSTRGINVLNFGPATSGQIIDIDIEDCDLYDNTLNLSEGVRLGNFQGATGSRIVARMTGNRSWGQKQGRLIVNNRANSSTIDVTSNGNRFFDNGGGTIVAGGLSSSNTRADGNTINLAIHGDRYEHNTAATELDRGGLFVLGIEDVSAAGGGSNNTVNVAMWGTRLADNANVDLAAIAARSLSAATASLSQNNRVTIEIHGAGQGKGRWQPVESFIDNLPAGPSYANTVIVTGH